MSNIQQLIQQAAGTYQNDEVRMALATVSSVDESSRMCIVSLVTGKSDVEIKAKLMASVDDGVLYIPSVDSQVALLYSNNNEPVIFMYSSIDKIKYIVGDTGIEITDGLIKLNDGKLNGLVKIADLVTKLNNIENTLNDLISKYNSHTHTGVTTGSGTSGVTGALETKTLTPTKQSDIENTKITHGSSL